MNIDKNGKLRGLTGKTTFTEEDLSPSVLVSTIMPLYRQAFKYGVWEEDLSIETVISRLEKNFSGKYKGFFLYDKGEVCIGASWYEFVNPEWLYINKYPKLAEFAENYIEFNSLGACIWQAETMVHPDFQNQGIASFLKQKIDDSLRSGSKQTNGAFVCTRLREDNSHIIKINLKYGFQRTGITMPCSLKPETNHEFWYKIYH